MIRPMITSMVNPDAGVSAITRHLTKLDDVLNSHFTYDNTLVFGGSDTFEFEFLAPSSVVPGTQYLIDGDSSSDRVYFGFKTDGLYLANSSEIDSLNIDGVDVSLSATPYPTDGKLYKAVLTLKAGARIGILGSRYTLSQEYPGIMVNPKATISGVTTTNTLGLAAENSEPSAEGNNTITYVNIPNSNRELYQLSVDETQWDNISPSPQELPSVIEIA